MSISACRGPLRDVRRCEVEQDQPAIDIWLPWLAGALKLERRHSYELKFRKIVCLYVVNGYAYTLQRQVSMRSGQKADNPGCFMRIILALLTSMLVCPGTQKVIE